MATLLAALAGVPAMAAAQAPEPVAGQHARFAAGAWSALPQTGPDGKVRQCVLVAMRPRSQGSGKTDTRLSITISRGSGLVMTLMDDRLPNEQVLDDQAEILVDGRSFPSVAFSVGTALALHPGNAESLVAALAGAGTVALRSDGAGVESGAIALDLPPDALAWLTTCGSRFGIPIDRPSDPNAPDLPTPRQRSPKISVTPATQAGPPGIEDKQKIDGWDASELRDRDGAIIVCFIRRNYQVGAEPAARRLGVFLMASRLRGLTMMIKDSRLDLPEGKPVPAAVKIGGDMFPAVSAQVLGRDEIGLFPEHGTALAAAIEARPVLTMKAKGIADLYEFSVQPGVVRWLRACARRNGISIEAAAK